MSEIDDLEFIERDSRGDTLSEKAAKLSATHKKRNLNGKRLDRVRMGGLWKASVARRSKSAPITLPKINF